MKCNSYGKISLWTDIVDVCWQGGTNTITYRPTLYALCLPMVNTHISPAVLN